MILFMHTQLIDLNNHAKLSSLSVSLVILIHFRESVCSERFCNSSGSLFVNHLHKPYEQFDSLYQYSWIYFSESVCSNSSCKSTVYGTWTTQTNQMTKMNKNEPVHWNESLYVLTVHVNQAVHFLWTVYMNHLNETFL